MILSPHQGSVGFRAIAASASVMRKFSNKLFLLRRCTVTNPKKDRSEFASLWPPTAETATEAGHKPVSPLTAIRKYCLDCSGYQTAEVRLCEAIKCPLWPFRAGKHPWHSLAKKPAYNLPNSQQDMPFDEGHLVSVPLSPDDNSQDNRIDSSDLGQNSVEGNPQDNHGGS